MHWLWQEVKTVRAEAIARAAQLQHDGRQPGANHWQRMVADEAMNIVASSERDAGRRLVDVFREHYPRAAESVGAPAQAEAKAASQEFRVMVLRVREISLMHCELAMARESLAVWRTARRRIKDSGRSWASLGS